MRQPGEKFQDKGCNFPPRLLGSDLSIVLCMNRTRWDCSRPLDVIEAGSSRRRGIHTSVRFWRMYMDLALTRRKACLLREWRGPEPRWGGRCTSFWMRSWDLEERFDVQGRESKAGCAGWWLLNACIGKSSLVEWWSRESQRRLPSFILHHEEFKCSEISY